MNDQAIDDDGVEVAPGTPYWPPDHALRLECLRIAAGAKPNGNVLAEAKYYYEFVKGTGQA